MLPRKNKAGYTAVELAKDTHTIEVMKAEGATMPEIPYQRKDALLIEYAEKGCPGGVLMALKAGSNVNHKNSPRSCPSAREHGAGSELQERGMGEP